MKPYARHFYNSRQWVKCRDSYIKKVHGLCERCSSGGKVVHHKEYITPNNIHDHNITLNHDNLELLCQDCHNKEHHSTEDSTRDDVTFDSEGNLVYSPH